MNTKKLVIAFFIIVIAVLAVMLLWKYPIILIIFLICLALIKRKLSPINKELPMFIIGGLVGVFAESFAMIGGPWAYASSTIFNFPIWLPFLWGLASITGITLYQGLSE